MLDKDSLLQKFEDSQIHDFKTDGFEIEEQIKLPGHSWNISSVQFNQDGLYLASASWDKTILVWDLKTLEDPTILENEHTSPVTCISWFPCIKSMLVSGSSDNSLAIWNIESSEAVVRLYEHDAWVLSTSFTKDGEYLVSSSWKGDAIIWDMTSLLPLVQLNGHLEGVWCSAFNAVNPNLLCTASEDSSLRIWDLRNDHQWHSDVILSGVHRQAIKSCVWSPCGNYIAAGSKDSKISIWDTRINKAVNCLFGHTGSVMDLTFFSSSLLFSVGDTQFCAWNVFDGGGKPFCSLQQHSWSYEVECIALSPDNTLLATGSVDRNVTLSTIEVSDEFCERLPYNSENLPYANTPAKNQSATTKEILTRKSSADVLDSAVNLTIVKEKELDQTVAKQTIRIKAPVTSELLQNKLNQLKTVDNADGKRESVLNLFRQKSLRVDNAEKTSSDSLGRKSKELIEGKKINKVSTNLNSKESSCSRGNKTDFLSELIGKFPSSQEHNQVTSADISNFTEDEGSEESLNYDIENVTSEMIRITVEEENKGSYDIKY